MYGVSERPADQRAVRAGATLPVRRSSTPTAIDAHPVIASTPPSLEGPAFSYDTAPALSAHLTAVGTDVRARYYVLVSSASTASTTQLAGFHPAVAAWFGRRFPDGPTEPQARGWQLIARGQDTLIAAPTGSGKTLAGFLVAIDALYQSHEEGIDVEVGTRVVYVSPLRALAVDIAENLERPLAEIAGVAAELGMTAPNIRVAVRTGDSTSSDRSQMLRRPPSFVVTTPESLYLLVSGARGRAALRQVDTVIVDEIHALARDKRGAHLALTLERLEALSEKRPKRIGLSATQRPIETVGRLLVGDRPAPAVVDVGHRRDLDLAIELPDGELEAVASHEQM